jgi:hypothetical protein
MTWPATLERIGRSWEARLARIKRLAEGAG